MTASRPHILILAYVIGPDQGSEHAAAWGMALVAAEIGDVTIACSPACEPQIRKWLAAHPDRAMAIVSVEPKASLIVKALKKLPRGCFFEYFGWLAALPTVMAEIHARHPVDLAVHAALGSHWLPSPVAGLGVPSVWGSVGGATPVAPGLLSVLGLKGMVERVVELVAITIGSNWPATRRTMREATVVLLENEIVRKAMPRDVAERAEIFQRALLTDAPELPARPRSHDILFPSTLHGRKGAMLALEAFAAHVPAPYRLVFVNQGPDEGRMRQRAKEMGLEARVEFRGKIPREEYFLAMKGAAMAVFAGVNEDGGCALCEAMLLGVPVVVLAHSGPKEIVERWSLDPDRVAAVTPAGGVAGTTRALGEAMSAIAARALTRTDPYLDRARAVGELQRVYRSALAARGTVEQKADPSVVGYSATA